MFRLWIAAAAVLFFLIWILFFQAIVVLVIFAVVVGCIWIWWEVRELKKAMRTPPR